MELKEIEKKVRSLTWGERKTLRKEGILLTRDLDNETGEDIIETVLTMVFGDNTLDDLPVFECHNLYVKIVQATYGQRKEEAKN